MFALPKRISRNKKRPPSPPTARTTTMSKMPLPTAASGTKTTSKPSFPDIGTENTLAIIPLQKFEGHTGSISGVIHLPDGQRIITCSWDGSLRVWNLRSGKQIGEEWREGESEVRSIALSPDGKMVVSGSEDGAVRLWDIDTGKVIVKWTDHGEHVKSVCWSRDGERVVSGCYDGTVRQWDVTRKSGEPLAPIKTGHKHLYVVVYSPDTAMMATAGYDGDQNFIKIWDAKTGRQVTTLRGHTSTVVCLAWTTDGKTLISGSTNHSVRTWNTKTWEQTTVLKPVQFAHGTLGSLWAIAISSNGCILASASSDCTTRLWNLDNGQPISPTLKHANTVTCMSFSADGKQLATGCHDYNTYTWDVSAIVGENNNDLLLDLTSQSGKSALNTDATRPPVQRPEGASHRRIPPGFFDLLPNVDGHPIQQAVEVDPRPLDFFGLSRDRSSPTRRPPYSMRYGPAVEVSVPPDGHNSFLRHFSSLFHHSQPDPDVTLHLSPRPWLGFFSRRTPSPRTVGQRTSRRYVAPVPNIRRTSQGRRRRDQNQGGTSLSPTSHSQPAGATTSASAPPPPRPRPLSVTNLAVTPVPQQTGYWTLFLCRICCFGCCYICRGSNESSDDSP